MARLMDFHRQQGLDVRKSPSQALAAYKRGRTSPPRASRSAAAYVIATTAAELAPQCLTPPSEHPLSLSTQHHSLQSPELPHIIVEHVGVRVEANTSSLPHRRP
jgi:hypothetical protein